MGRISQTALLAGAALAASCAPQARLVQGSLDAGEGYRVQLGRTWSDVTPIMVDRTRNVRVLSVDGPHLNRLYLAGAVRAGDPIVRAMRREQPTPVFRADMTDTELVEFVTDSIAALGYQRPEATNLRPGTLAGVEGVRFEVTTQTPEGLAYDGTSLVARQGESLHLMLYLAPREHYYGTLAQEVETIFASAALSE
ncbi:MAG: hypothetical protein AB7J28_05735 [Hyphomonadaceae bacterium]